MNKVAGTGLMRSSIDFEEKLAAEDIKELFKRMRVEWRAMMGRTDVFENRDGQAAEPAASLTSSGALPPSYLGPPESYRNAAQDRP